MKTSSYCLVLLLCLSTLSSCRQIEVPFIKDNSPIRLKLGSSKVIKQPDFDFTKVYNRSVSKLVSGSPVSFPPCRQNKPQVQFTVLDQVVFEGIPERPVVITNFDDIRYSQFLLDMYYQFPYIYVMFKNGKLYTIKMSANDRIQKHTLTNIQKVEQLSVGYFIKINSDILFVNDKYIIKVNNNKKQSPQLVKGYTGHEDFQSVLTIADNYFIVVDESDGIVVYQYISGTVKKIQNINSQVLTINTNETQFKDIAYSKQDKVLFTCDEISGVTSYKIQYKSDDSIKISTPVTIGNVKNCKLMYLLNQTLYVYGQSLHSFNLQRYPIFKQKKVPQPNIQIRQIYSTQNLVAFVGRNVFSLMYLDRTVDYYQDDSLDKLIIDGNVFLSANEGGIDIGTFSLIKPYITCNTEDTQYQGVSDLVWTTVAQCNSSYFKKYQVKQQGLGRIDEQDDVCHYIVYRSVDFWQVGEIKTQPFIGGILVLTILVALAVCIFVFKSFRISRYQKMIQEYSQMHNNSESAKHQELAQEMDGGQSVFKRDVKPSIQKEVQGKKESQEMFGDVNER